MADEKKETKVEVVKRASRYLRGTIAETLASDAPKFEQDEGLLKFHGIYQQYDRDARRAGGTGKAERQYSFMIRLKVPGGVLTAEQYLALDGLAEQWGGGSLRITTRQDFQFHGVLKTDLKAMMAAINRTLVTTLGACGDITRNVMACPAPTSDSGIRLAQELAQRITSELAPRTRAYYEIWLDGEKVETAEDEPLYGPQYLPRKFKIGVAPPGDNCIDVYSQDVGLVAVLRDGELAGVNILVGGGFGMTHGKADTFARLATPLGYVDIEHTLPAVRAITAIFRDFGNRTDRRHARLKYVLHEWGEEKFRAEFEQRVGFRVGALVDTGPWQYHDHLGLHPEGDGRFYYGLFIENGRINDTETRKLKTGLREIVASLRPGVVLTPGQNIIFTHLDERSAARLEDVLDDYGIVRSTRISLARRYAMACPALPTCGLAISDAERIMPSVVDQFEQELTRLGVDGEPLTIRMTGCPNGCARPYTADIAFVGRALGTYDVYVGGRLIGDRLVDLFAENVPQDGLVENLRPLLESYARERQPAEGFGDYYQRTHGNGHAKTILTGGKHVTEGAGRRRGVAEG